MTPGGYTNYTEGPDFAPNAAPAVVAGPPLEEHLAQNTLWPEVHKLYGHGNDVYCVAASRDGRYIASGCIAKSPAAAEVWVWAVGSWCGVAQLPVSCHRHSGGVADVLMSSSGRCAPQLGAASALMCIWAICYGG